VHGRHEALLDAELLVNGLHQRREAVGSARGARDDRHRSRIVVVRVDADDDGRGLGILGWSRDDDLFRATVNVLHAVRRGGEGAGRLADILHAGVLPGDLSRVAGGRQCDLEAVDHETAVGQLARALEAAMHGVVLKQILHVLGRHRRVDMLEHEGLAVQCNAHHLAADAAEAVDAKLDGRVGIGGHHDGRSVRSSERGESSEHV